MIGKSSHHSFNISILIISCHEPYSSLSTRNDNKLTNFLLVKSTVIVKHFYPQKRVEDVTIFLNQQCTMYLLKSLLF